MSYCTHLVWGIIILTYHEEFSIKFIIFFACLFAVREVCVNIFCTRVHPNSMSLLGNSIRNKAQKCLRIPTVMSMCSTNANSNDSISSLPQNTKVANSTHDPIAGRRRFYKHVGVAESKDNSGLYNVLLDGRVLKSPAMAPFEMPNRVIATIIAGEWDAQDDRLGIQPTSMAFMKLAATAVDQIVPDSEFTKQHCVSFLPTDTVLYFTDEEDRILLRKQQKHFTPLIKWMNSEFGIDLNVSYGGMRKLVHSPETVERVRAAVDALSPFELACLQCVTMECKSIIIALALLHRKISLSDAIVVSRLEEELQCEVWGVVEGGHDIDRLHNKIRISSACLMYELLQ